MVALNKNLGSVALSSRRQYLFQLLVTVNWDILISGVFLPEQLVIASPVLWDLIFCHSYFFHFVAGVVMVLSACFCNVAYGFGALSEEAMMGSQEYAGWPAFATTVATRNAVWHLNNTASRLSQPRILLLRTGTPITGNGLSEATMPVNALRRLRLNNYLQTPQVRTLGLLKHFFQASGAPKRLSISY